MNMFIPVAPIHYNKQHTWFNSDIQHHINCLRTLRCKLNKNPTNNNLVKYDNSTNPLHSSAKDNYESRLIISFANTNNSKIYKYIRSVSKSSSIPSTMYSNSTSANTELEKANIFNDYFYSVFTQAPSDFSTPGSTAIVSINISISEVNVYNTLINLDITKASGPDSIPPIVLSKCVSLLCKPLHYLFSLSLKYGNLPTDWKIHKIIPIFKSCDSTLVKNYRPISLLSNTSKVLKRIIYDKIIDHISWQINPAQFGFMKNHSTAQQLLLFQSNAFASRHQLDTVYLDITKAFDTVCHINLLQKLNISGNLLTWFEQFLTDFSLCQLTTRIHIYSL